MKQTSKVFKNIKIGADNEEKAEMKEEQPFTNPYLENNYDKWKEAFCKVNGKNISQNTLMQNY